MADIFDMLDEFDSEWKKPISQYGDEKPWDTPLEDGDYSAVLEAITLKKAKSSGLPMVVWEFKIPSLNRKHWKNSVINIGKPATINILKRDMKAAGVELSGSIKQDIKALEGCVNNTYFISLVTRPNGFKETLINEGEDDDINF